MATFAWTLQGSSDTVIAATDRVQFAGSGGFDTKVTVGQYNDTTHVKTSGDADKSNGNTPNNNKFISATQVDIGSGTVLLTSLANGDAALKINFSDAASVAITNAVFYAYDGVTTTAAPTGVTFKAAEIGDSNWTDAEGSGSPVTLGDKAAATSHDFYIAASVSPDSVGLKSAFELRCELTYS
jgi:hypothetical protein